MLTLDEIRRDLGEVKLAYPADADLCFSGVINDSREAQPGELFIALRAERDGHDFIGDAYRRGAAGVLAERVVDLDWLPADQRHRFAYLLVPDSLQSLQHWSGRRLARVGTKVVALTGSVGKTLTKEVVAAVLAQRYRVLRSDRNLNNEIGLPLTLLRLEPEHERAVLEMGMYALGEISALCRIAHPTIGVVTNVGPVHLARLSTIDRIALAKSELVRALPGDGWAVLNGDDPRVVDMGGATSANKLFFGLGNRCDVRAGSITTHGLEGISFIAEHQGRSHSLRSPLPGRHSVYACLAAIAVGIVDGMEWEEIATGLATGPSQSRMVVVDGHNRSTILDDTYNASPASVVAALELLSELPGRRIAILADMLELGELEESAHREVGRCAAAKVDVLVVVGKRARWIGEEAKAVGLKDVAFVAHREEVAIDLQPGDYVLVKGSRSTEMERVVARLRLSPGNIAIGNEVPQ